MTRYVFVGAGAIGSALGGLLAQRGSSVLLVARGAHAAAMATGGLTLRCPDGTSTLRVPVATGPDGVRLTVDDVLVLTTKTHQAEAAVEQWADVPVHDHAGAVMRQRRRAAADLHRAERRRRMKRSRCAPSTGSSACACGSRRC